jgi:hypothetical protein
MTAERHAFLRLQVRHVAGHEVETTAADGESCIEQRHALLAAAGETAKLTLLVRGRLDRPALAEITEVSPLPPTGAGTLATPDGARLRLAAPDLPAGVTVEVAAGGRPPARWNGIGADAAQLVLEWTGRLELVVRCTVDALQAGPARATASARGPALRSQQLWTSRVRLHTGERHREALAHIRLGALRYVRGCTALRVGPREVCLLADHRILPLSWTRDAYYQALLLLASGDRDAGGLVADHLRWLFGRCRRDGAAWQRSHLANGERKDSAYQADQQLYPLLELADYRAATGTFPEAPEGTSWSKLVREVWRSLPISEQGLVSTDENPADDRSHLPHPLSTQILAWYLAVRLEELDGELELEPLALDEAAERLRASISPLFTRPGPHGDQWAYEIDGEGRARLYADANDLPTALAPAWGFCRADDPVWRATMRFAFSEHNPGYARGRLGGLGSLHTPGTWPLGDIQEWVAASLSGDPVRAEAALDRLALVRAGDGLLPETYDPDTGAWRARHWFAWPAAALGALASA